MLFIYVFHSGPFCAPSGIIIIFWWYKKSLGLQLLFVQCLKNRFSTTNTQGFARVVCYFYFGASCCDWVHAMNPLLLCALLSPSSLSSLWSAKWPFICTALVSYTSLILNGIRTHSELRSVWKLSHYLNAYFSLVVIVFFSCYKIPVNFNCPGGLVVMNLPANAEGMGSTPGRGRSHMPSCPATREARTRRSLHTALV